jgi:tetratricopeptide (TPR) repeat protein
MEDRHVQIAIEHQSILADPLVVSASEAPGTAPPPVARQYVALCQLPPDTADFVGRAEVADRLVGRLDAAGTTSTVATVVVSGPPGVGKSTLAVHAAHRLRPRFPDGQLYVSLAGGGPAPRDPAELLAELLHSTGTDALGVPAGLEARAAMWRARLADRRLLLVLDDAASAEQVRPLLPGTPGCAVLITSRNLLAVPPGATTLRLDPFTAEEAVELLGRLVGHGRVDAEPAAAREIGAACGGIPLALRIAGIRLATRPASPLASLAGRLQDTRHRLDELATGDSEVRASLELSYNLLEPATQTAFRRLGLLEGADFAAWTVAVLVGEPDGERIIERLAGANLLQPLGVDGTGEPRYRLHDLLFAYAAELAARDDPAANKLALHRYFDTLSALTAIVHSNQPRIFNDVAAMPRVSTAPAEGEIRRVGAEPIGWLAAERAHLCAAVAYACDLGRYPEAAMMLINLTPLLYQHGDLSPVIPLCVRVRDAAGGAGDEVDYWRVEQIRAFLVALKRPDEDATEALTSCAAGFERLGMDLERAHSLVLLSLYRNQGAPVEAHGHAERALGVARAIGDRHVQAMALTALAEANATLGRVALALAELEEALGIGRELGELHFQAEISSRLARRTMSAGDLDRAAVAAEAALRLFTDLRDRFHTGWIRGLLATISSAQGRAAEAVEHAEQGRRLFARMGEQRGEADLTMTLARAHLGVGRTNTAIGLLGQALQIAEDTGSAPLARRILRLLGDAHHAHGDRRAAERAYTRADALPENTDPLPGVVGGYIAAADG